MTKTQRADSLFLRYCGIQPTSITPPSLKGSGTRTRTDPSFSDVYFRARSGNWFSNGQWDWPASPRDEHELQRFCYPPERPTNRPLPWFTRCIVYGYAIGVTIAILYLKYKGA